VRGRPMDVLQAILAQDPSNEWAREQFRRLSTPTAATRSARPITASTASRAPCTA
jgi:hypothetical protein